jgi:hypothetical protein
MLMSQLDLAQRSSFAPCGSAIVSILLGRGIDILDPNVYFSIYRYYNHNYIGLEN